MLICPSNSPARGVDGPSIRTAETYEHLSKSFAQLMGAVVVLVNRVGFEDGLCFWGGSMAVGPDGRDHRPGAHARRGPDPGRLRPGRTPPPAADHSPGPRRTPAADHRRTPTASNGDAMNPEPVQAELAINAELVTAILTRFIRSEIRRAGFSRAVVGLSGGIDSSVVTSLAARALGPENVLAVTMPYKTSSEATRRDSQAVIEQLGVAHASTCPSPAQIDAYFARISRRRAIAAGQQVRPRADDRALRSERGLRGPGRRHEQQERAAAGLRHAVRRHGLGDQSGRRSLQDAALPVGGPSGRAAARSWTSRPPATSGSARPTRASWGSAMPRSIGCWCLMVDRRWRRAELLRGRLRRGVRRPRGRHDPPQPLQAPHAGDRQALAPHHGPRFPLRPGLGNVSGEPGA